MMIAHHKSFKSVSQNEKEATCVEVKFLFFEESQRRREMLVCEELRFYFAKCVEVKFLFFEESQRRTEMQSCEEVRFYFSKNYYNERDVSSNIDVARERPLQNVE